MTIRRLIMVAGVLGLGASLFAQGPRRDGQWEVKIEMQMAGMTMPAQTTTQCITAEQVKDPSKALPPTGRGGRGNDDCKVSDYKTEGNKVTWSMTCEKQQMKASGEMIYADSTYTGTMKMSARGQDMTMKMSGTRIGDCTK